MDRTIVDRTFKWGAFLSLILSWATASGDPWDFGLNIDLGVIYTDNVFLADEGLEESETAYTIVPEFVLSKDSERLQADIRYRPEAYFYSDFSDANDVYHVLNAVMTGALVKERLFLTLDAANYQSIVTPEGRYPTTNLPITNNRVDSSTFGVRPSWQQPIGSANLLLEAGIRRVDYDGDQFQSSDDKDGHFRLDNIESQKGLAWALDYQYRRMDYEVSLPYEYQQASLNLGFWLNGTFRIFAEGGVETPYDAILEPDMDADFWEAGFQYKPNQRLDIELAAGDRSYGESYRGRFSYELRRGNLTASYSEVPTTRADQAFDPRPITGTDNLDGILDRPGRSDRYIRRRAEFSVNIELAKSDLTIRIFDEQRDERTTADGTSLPDENSSGAAIRWSWDMGIKTTLGIGADISERDLAVGKDDLFRASIDLAYQFSPRLSLRAEAARSDQERYESSSFDYTENQVGLYLNSEF